jgi:hypothetical protein
MDLERAALLVRRIAEKSKAGELEWFEQSTNVFTTEIGKYRISVVEHTSDYDASADPDYAVSISAKAGERWIDSLSDEDLKDVLPGSYKLMASLFRDARRRARGVADVVEDLLKDIDGKN